MGYLAPLTKQLPHKIHCNRVLGHESSGQCSSLVRNCVLKRFYNEGMKRFSWVQKFLLFLGLFLRTVSPVLAQTAPPEYISTFESQIEIQPNTDIVIEERIVFHTDVARHGIYRYIPYRYTRNRVSHTAQVRDITIEDEQGRAYQVETTRENGVINLRIGDSDSTFTGDKTYILRYRVEQALQQQDEGDELYWDITGEGWQFPVQSVSATIISPAAEIGQLRCFTGAFGSTDANCTFEKTASGATLRTISSVLPGENFTIVAQLPRPNQLQFPSEQEKFINGLVSNWWLPVVLLPIVFMGWFWIKKGRDWMFLSPNVFALEETAPRQIRPLLHRLRVPMVYEPIADLTPAEVGAIENERLESREIVAEIVDLARQKYLKIESNEKKGLLGSSLGQSTEYSLKKLASPSKKPLAAHQAYLLKALFKSGDTVRLKDLHGKFATQWEKFQNLVWDSVTQKQFFAEKPSTVRGKYLAVCITMLSLAFVLATWVMASWVDSFVPMLLVLLQIVPVIFLALSMPRKTARGLNIALQARGLKATIERGAWREKIKEKHLFIEEVLPFAVAFGVVDQLAAEMKRLGEEPPRYLGNAALNAASFQNFSSSFTSQASSNLTYNPSSSHSSGGSGFSGGSSGGGGGGGGGGSW